jgi:hypothetical protein
MLLEIRASWRPDKKLVAIFDDHRPVHFGARGYKNYAVYRRISDTLARQKRASYIARHGATEAWTDPHAPGTLSRYILWEFSPDDAVENYNLLFF